MFFFLRIIPAYAGSTDVAPRRGIFCRDHPRIRGEHSAPRWAWSQAPGSSPHTREAPSSTTGQWYAIGIIPAYAGSTTLWKHVVMACGDHPRIRGEHRKRSLLKRFVTGSSPHTRGALTRSWPSSSASGIIPAYAGSTTSWAIANAASGDHPRIRGEHSFACLHELVNSGSSPHTRGARHAPALGRIKHGIIPAYAGSTRSRLVPCRRKRDHPRIRGEHGTEEYGRLILKGSSPHTRGARR